MSTGRRARTCLRMLAAFAALAGAPPAQAAGSAPFTLSWQAPAGCPGRSEVAQRVTQLLGERGVPLHTLPLDAHGVVALLPDGRFRAELGTVQAGAARSRVLEAPTCSEVTEASVVVIALAISPDTEVATNGVEMPPLESESALDTAPTPVTPAATAESAPVHDRASSPRANTRASEITLHWHARAGLTADLGAVAPVSPGVTLTAGARYARRAELSLRGSYFPGRDTSVAAAPSQGVTVELGALSPVLCALPLDLPVLLGVCGEVEAGYLHARAFGPLTHFGRTAFWLAPGAGLFAAFPARGRFRSVLAADLLFPISRTKFVLTDVGVARRLPGATGRIGLALEVVFL